MTDEVISPLRRRMIEDMTIRKLVPMPWLRFSRRQNLPIRVISPEMRLNRPVASMLKS
jgi:hypothetical protein